MPGFRGLVCRGRAELCGCCREAQEEMLSSSSFPPLPTVSHPGLPPEVLLHIWSRSPLQTSECSLDSRYRYTQMSVSVLLVRTQSSRRQRLSEHCSARLPLLLPLEEPDRHTPHRSASCSFLILPLAFPSYSFLPLSLVSIQCPEATGGGKHT